MNFNNQHNRIAAAGLIVALLAVIPARAEKLNASVVDGKKKPVRDAVVYLLPADGKAPAAKAGTVAVMDQVHKEFVPYVLAAQKGSLVSFPNSDNILHHVYSFSKAKSFELPLYKGKPQSPLKFDNAGVVALGCNIHDWMKGYIVVLDTPYFGVVDKNGRAVVSAPPGEYVAKVWQPDLKGTASAVSNGRELAKHKSSGDDASPDGWKLRIEKSSDTEAVFSVTVKGAKKKSGAGGPSGVMQY